jgi:hypothetical protein
MVMEDYTKTKLTITRTFLVWYAGISLLLLLFPGYIP